MRTTVRKLGIVERLRISRCLQGVHLACGCRVGLYETADEVVMTIVDDPADDCADRTHQTDFVIAEVDCRAARSEVA